MNSDESSCASLAAAII